MSPEAALCGMRPQLLLLPAYAGKDIAQEAADAWLGLARAAHHHAYELAPQQPNCAAGTPRSRRSTLNWMLVWVDHTG